MGSSVKKHSFGFTIVELLIVIVVIAILAAITIVAFNGVQARAVESSMQSDLRNALSAIELEKAEAGRYPETFSLKASNSNEISYEARGDSYCAAAKNARTGSTYRIKGDGGGVVKGNCDPIVTTFTGIGYGFADGAATIAKFAGPQKVVFDGSGIMYVADLYTQKVRKVTRGGVVSTMVGMAGSGFVDGTSAEARFRSPMGLAIDAQGTVYVADADNHRIREISASGTVSTFVGNGDRNFADGTGTAAKVAYPQDVVFDNAGMLYVADMFNQRIRKITPAGVVTTLAGGGHYTGDFADGNGTIARFKNPTGLVVDGGGFVYVADSSNHRIRKISPAGIVTTLAGSGAAGYSDGDGQSAEFNLPSDVDIDSAGNVYVADRGNHRIRKITPSGTVSTVAGSGVAGVVNGVGIATQFNQPVGVTLDSTGDLFISDSGNSRIRKISL